MIDENKLFVLFEEMLQYYWSTEDGVPASIRLVLAVNGWPSCNAACCDIAMHCIRDRKLQKRAQRMLIHVQCATPDVWHD